MQSLIYQNAYTFFELLFENSIFKIVRKFGTKFKRTLEIPSNEIPSNESSLIRARYRSLQRAADQPLFPHYYGKKRARIQNSN